MFLSFGFSAQRRESSFFVNRQRRKEDLVFIFNEKWQKARVGVSENNVYAKQHRERALLAVDRPKTVLTDVRRQ